MDGEKRPLYCSKHSKKDMVDVVTKRCSYKDCTERAYYNYKESKSGLYCKIHKLKDMVLVNIKKCKTEMCDTIVKKKYDGYCLFCYTNLFPDKKVFRNYKTKERSVCDYVKDKFPNHNWVTDRKVKDGCSNRRPDLMVDLGHQVIIVEIDENKHANYDTSCENKRLMEISQDLNHVPLVFIRFNPDGYKIGDKDKSSCWRIDTHGISIIKDKKEWNDRLNVLEQHINYWMNNATEKTVEVVHLFYDTV